MIRMNAPILKSSLRSFLISFCAVLGIGAASIALIFVLVLLISSLESELEVKSHYNYTVLPNGDNIRKVISKKAPVILSIDVDGMIGLDNLDTKTVREMLIESREGLFKDNRVKAVLVHINSPGGTVIDADGIYRALKNYKEKHKVPVFAYVDGLCASGGMYVASAADRIYASDASIVGSVGVLMPPFFNVVGLMDKIGVETKTLFAGKGKEDLNPFRPWKSNEGESIKAVIDSYYSQFVDIVTSNRPSLNRTRLINDYGANIFPAAKAVEYGYIDGSGYSLNETIKLLAKNIGIEDEYYQVIKMERKISLSDLIDKRNPLITGKFTHTLEAVPGMDGRLVNHFLYLYLPN